VCKAFHIMMLVIVFSGLLGAAHASPQVMAHRGCCMEGSLKNAPENTHASFAYAASVGAHMFETDLHLTKDGVIALIHDPTLDRTTNCTGKVVDYTMAEIKKCDAGSWLSPEFSSERVLTLREGLQFAKANSMTMVLDLKVPGLGPKIRDAMQDISFDMINAIPSVNLASDITGIVEALPNATIMVNVHGMLPTTPSGVTSSFFSNLRGLGVSIIFPSDNDLDQVQTVHENFVDEAARRGMQTWVWTLDKPKEWSHYAKIGVGGVCTNDPASALAIFNPKKLTIV